MKDRKIKFKLFPAKRYLGKVEHTKTLYKITIGTDLLKDEVLFITTLIHELIHIDYEELFVHNILTEEETGFADFAHDRYWTGSYCVLAIDNLRWQEKRKIRKMKV